MRGLAEDLAEVLPGSPEVEAFDAGDDGVRVSAYWTDGSKLKLYVRPDHVLWVDLTAGEKRAGLYSTLAEVTPPFFKERGAQYYLATPGSPEAREALFKRLDWYDLPNGQIRTDL